MKRLTQQLYFWVLVAIVVGGGLGYAAPETAVKLKPLADGFIALIKMLIGPIIFCTVVLGIAGAGDMKKVGRVGAKALLTSKSSPASRWSSAWSSSTPSPGRRLQRRSGDARRQRRGRLREERHGAEHHPVLSRDIPTTFVSAFAGGNLLQVLLVAILFGYAMTHMGERGRPVHDFIDACSHVFFG